MTFERDIRLISFSCLMKKANYFVKYKCNKKVFEVKISANVAVGNAIKPNYILPLIRK